MRSVRVSCLSLLIVLMATLGVVGADAEECGWLPVERLNEAFPDQAPWSTMVGGSIGSCKFLGSGLPHLFSATQIVKATPKEAEEYVSALREGMKENYEVTAAPELGELAFRYRPRPEVDDSGRAVFFVGHRDRVVVMSSLNFQKAITEEQMVAAQPLIHAALALADDEKAIEAATSCPWFDETVLDELFGGASYSENVFGETSCMANVDTRVLMVKILETDNPAGLIESMSSLAGGSCTSERLPGLAGAAVLEYACSSGNPRASVRLAAGAAMIEYTFAPGEEPTAEERALLIELARHALKRAGG